MSEESFDTGNAAADDDDEPEHLKSTAVLTVSNVNGTVQVQRNEWQRERRRRHPPYSLIRDQATDRETCSGTAIERHGVKEMTELDNTNNYSGPSSDVNNDNNRLLYCPQSLVYCLA